MPRRVHGWALGTVAGETGSMTVIERPCVPGSGYAGAKDVMDVDDPKGFCLLHNKN
jgi:hypothetical protein